MKKAVKKGQEWWFQLVEGYRLLENRAEYARRSWNQTKERKVKNGND